MNLSRLEEGPSLVGRAAMYSAGGFPGASRPPRAPMPTYLDVREARPAGLSSEGLAVASRGSGGTVAPLPFEARSVGSSASTPKPGDQGRGTPAGACRGQSASGGAGSPSDLIGAQKVGWDPSRVRQRTPSPSSAAGSDAAGGRLHGSDERRGRQSVEPPTPASGFAGAPSEQAFRWGQGHARQVSPSAGRSVERGAGPAIKRSGFEPKPRHSSPAAQQHRRPGSSAFGEQVLIEPGVVDNLLKVVQPPAFQPNHMMDVPDSPTPSASMSNVAASNAAPSTPLPRDPQEMTPEAVTKWLGTMSSCIPNQVLTDLRYVVAARGISGPAFAALLSAMNVEALDIENLSPMHLSRLRKAWNADYPRSLPAAPWAQRRDDVSSGFSSVPAAVDAPTRLHNPTYAWQQQDGSAIASTTGRRAGGESQDAQAQLLASVINRLANWADFDRGAAVGQLVGLLPSPLVHALSAELEQMPLPPQNASKRGFEDRVEAQHMMTATFAPEHRAPNGSSPFALEASMSNGSTAFGHEAKVTNGSSAAPSRKAKKGNVRDTEYVAAWIRSLPTTQIPESEREDLAASVEDLALDGEAFSKAVADPASLAELGVQHAARAVKLRKAWDQVLREDACKAAAIESAAKAGAVGKGVKLSC
mmetsp:Transcript_43641/g.79579  ORF Transcript_43641/g.79579 Transcript_43641/m.79579 type:complete len:644 (-) Transcript_43641:32-1963(-)